MDTERVKTTNPPGVLYPNIKTDFEWVRQHRKELLEKYGECVILVYHEQVVGKGQTIAEAIDDAEAQLPSDSSIITPFTYHLNYPYRLRRVNPTAS